MVIKTTNNNKTIIQQLTEFMNQAFNSTLTQKLNGNEAMQTIKTSTTVNHSFEEKGREFEVLFEFIHAWANESYSKEVYNYTRVMNYNNERLIQNHWVTRSPNYCVDEKTVLEYEHNDNPNGFTIKTLRSSYKPSLNKDHPIHNDSIANSLLENYKAFKGTVEEAVLVLIKPLLIKGFIESMIAELKVTTEFIGVINNYNNNDYHLNRFVESLEKGMMDDYSYPLELKELWGLWDEQFLKDRVVPFLKQKELSESQKKSIQRRLYKSCDEVLSINNYYDYCLVYKHYYSDFFPELDASLFFYDKKEFEHTVRIILMTLENTPRFFNNKAEAVVTVFNKKTNKVFRCSRRTLDD